MYSSMSYLVELPYDYVKIDRGFVEDIGKNVKKRSLVKSLLTLAKDLNIIVIAEGVNNELELRELEMLGVKYIQGFYFQRPYKI
jgi:EAL domain-containing protein (putative c-di-GMP-specific phosphodiesterase class I)